jgi:hypothetical protein
MTSFRCRSGSNKDRNSETKTKITMYQLNLTTLNLTTGLLAAMLGLFVLQTAIRGWSAGCVPPPPGLVGWWPGEGNANDLSDKNNGTMLNGANASASGMVGQAFNLDGADDASPDQPAQRLCASNWTTRSK